MCNSGEAKALRGVAKKLADISGAIPLLHTGHCYRFWLAKTIESTGYEFLRSYL